jgi:hypothetical protein
MRMLSWCVLWTLAAVGCERGAPAEPRQVEPPVESGDLAVPQAQAAVDEWLRQPNTPNGSAVVRGLRTLDSNWVVADLQTKNFVDEDGHISPTEDPALAEFARGGNGQWVLTRVTWDGGRVTAAPNIGVQ